MALAVLFCLSLFTPSTAHSTLGDPRPTVSRACRLGGSPLADFKTCPGPCDISIRRNQRNVTSPNNPAHVYSRGQVVSIKYQRNNHGPGGFLRLSLVPIDKMMSKEAHAANAFHYSCWGAVSVAADSREQLIDKQGYSLVGSDGKFHNLPTSYYEVKVKIPTVVPDGVYALGYVWYGGMGGTIYQNTPRSPFKYGHFADYWACAYVKIQGGTTVQSKYTPVFENNLNKFWGNGCMSANDAPGYCSYEPCKVEGHIQMPKEFKNGSQPKHITPSNFARTSQSNRNEQDYTIPTPVPESKILREALRTLYKIKQELWALRKIADDN